MQLIAARAALSDDRGFEKILKAFSDE